MNTRTNTTLLVAAIASLTLSSPQTRAAPKPPAPANPGAPGYFPKLPKVTPDRSPEGREVKSRVISVPKDKSLVAAALAEYPDASSGHGGIASRELPFPINLTPLSLSSGDAKKPPRVLDHIAVFAVDQVDPNDRGKVQLRLVRYALARPDVMSLYVLVPPEGRPTGLVVLYSDRPFVKGASPQDVLERLDKENSDSPGEGKPKPAKPAPRKPTGTAA